MAVLTASVLGPSLQVTQGEKRCGPEARLLGAGRWPGGPGDPGGLRPLPKQLQFRQPGFSLLLQWNVS